MNTNDAEVVWSILKQQGYEKTENPLDADVWLIVTCSIRESAETKIWKKLNYIRKKKSAKVFRPTLKVGILGCMAERLKSQILTKENVVDVVAGPDA